MPSEVSSPSEADSDVSWIESFCRNYRCFVQVDSSFIEDEFNLYGLSAMVSHYKLAKALILDNQSVVSECYHVDYKEISYAARDLYGLIHARYILTNQGVSRIEELYRRKVFGTCPNCATALLPYGKSPTPRVAHTTGYCMNCKECYDSEHNTFRYIDGAYFGPHFCHLYELMLRSLQKSQKAKSARSR